MGSREEVERNLLRDSCPSQVNQKSRRGTQRNEDRTDTDSIRIPEYCQSIRITDTHGHVKEVLFPRALDLDRPKRSRTTFSTNQLKELEEEFQRNQYLAGRDRSVLANKLGLSETQIKVWFQNRRTKRKREKVRDLEFQKSTAESTATCNVLRLLQQNSPTSFNTNNSTGYTFFTPFASNRI